MKSILKTKRRKGNGGRDKDDNVCLDSQPTACEPETIQKKQIKTSEEPNQEEEERLIGP